MVENLKSCRERRAELNRELSGLTTERSRIGTAAVAAKRNMTDQERASWLSLGAKVEALKKQAEENDELLRAAEEANEAERRGGSVVSGDTEAHLRAMAQAGFRIDANTGGGMATLTADSALVRSSARQIVERVMSKARPSAQAFGSFEEYLTVSLSGRHDPRLMASAQEGQTPSLGEFGVPTQFVPQVLQPLIEKSFVLQNCRVWPMSAKTLMIPCFQADGGNDGPYGVPVSWVPEDGETEMDQQVFKLRSMNLTAHSMSLYVAISNALLQDGVGFATQLQAAMAGDGGWHLEKALMTGDGAGKPLGFLGSSNPARIVVARGLAGHVTYDDTTAMLARLSPSSFVNSMWITSQTCLPELQTMSVAVGTGGQVLPAVLNRDGNLSLHTRPMVITEKASALGVEGDLALVDLSAYNVGLRADLSIDVSPHVLFRSNATALRLIVRVDGQPGLAKPYQPPNSAATQSPFVVLGS